jgi:hypothetical protein
MINYKLFSDFIKESSRFTKDNGTETLIDDEKCTLLHVFHQSAMQIYGSGTRWDITSKKDNSFYFYQDQGWTIYILLLKGTGIKDDKILIGKKGTGNRIDAYDVQNRWMDAREFLTERDLEYVLDEIE